MVPPTILATLGKMGPDATAGDIYIYIYGLVFTGSPREVAQTRSVNCTNNSWSPRSVTRGDSRTGTRMCNTAGAVEDPTSHKNNETKLERDANGNSIQSKPQAETRHTHTTITNKELIKN